MCYLIHKDIILPRQFLNFSHVHLQLRLLLSHLYNLFFVIIFVSFKLLFLCLLISSSQRLSLGVLRSMCLIFTSFRLVAYMSVAYKKVCISIVFVLYWCIFIKYFSKPIVKYFAIFLDYQYLNAIRFKMLGCLVQNLVLISE